MVERERFNLYRSDETPSQSSKRRTTMLSRKRRRFSLESETQRAKRRLTDATRKAASRSKESEIDRERRLRKERESKVLKNKSKPSKPPVESSSAIFPQLTAEDRDYLWRKVNQCEGLSSASDHNDFEILRKEYQEDVTEFQRAINHHSWESICAVCGLSFQTSSLRNLHCEDKLFDPLRETSCGSSKKEWVRYGSVDEEVVRVCQNCLRALKRNKVPKLSRKNILLSPTPPVLQNLSEIEQLLISPILPMRYVYRHRTFGQYQSRGQCVAFYNRFQSIAKVLPRLPEDVVVNLKDMYGNRVIEIHPMRLRKALLFLKETHPGFSDITISEDNLKAIQEFRSQSSEIRDQRKRGKQCDNTREMEEVQQVATKNFVSETEEPPLANHILHDAGQHQSIEETVAQSALESTVAVDARNSISEFKESVEGVFKAISKRQAQLYTGASTTEGWELMFPCLMWKGSGGPQGSHESVSLRDWVNYVVRLNALFFHSHVFFVSFSNNVLRRQKITGITSNKPIGTSVNEAVDKLISISKQPIRERKLVPDAQALANQVSVYLNDLPGSISDMKFF